MDKKKVIVSGFILLLLILGIVFIKPSKKLKFKTESLVSIRLKEIDESTSVDPKDFEKFIEELNNLKYKSKNTGVKTKGEYFIILTYEKEEYEIGRYYSNFKDKGKYTLFTDEFDELVIKWLEQK